MARTVSGALAGDVAASTRRAIERDPPDLLLTSPESLEAMLLSPNVAAGSLLGRLDGGDGGRAVVGSAEDSMAGVHGWGSGGKGTRTDVEIEIDAVGSLAGAAQLIAGLHYGQKRLVFADRSRVEQLAAMLRRRGVEVHVSHSSLSRDERRQAERAFAESRDCVIIATSTLELGVDVGDLDHVIQIGAPRTVSAVLQRLGRTGRRPGTSRNCLFLTTTEAELLQALALVALARDGWVEPLIAPARPVNLIAQQLPARVLADGRVGRSEWPGPLEPVLRKAGIEPQLPIAVLETILEHGPLIEDHGLVSIGMAGERNYGRRNSMDVTSMFLSEPLLAVRWGRKELGFVDPSSLWQRHSSPGGEHERPVLQLGGRRLGCARRGLAAAPRLGRALARAGALALARLGRGALNRGLPRHAGRALRRRQPRPRPHPPCHGAAA